MAERKRRDFKRRIGKRRYKTLFVISVEGRITENQYFGFFNYGQTLVKVKCLKDRTKSDPSHVLKRMKTFLRDNIFEKEDQAWLVVDKDLWTDDQLNQLFDWSQQADNYGFALSNPKFEFWLLLHFEDGSDITEASDCDFKLGKHLSNYNKNIQIQDFPIERIRTAIEHAKNKDNPPCKKWPIKFGNTTVYKLVEEILGKNSDYY